MKTHHVRPDVEVNLDNLTHDPALWQAIQGYDLTVVTRTFAERCAEHAAVAETLELECKRFLYLAAIAPNLALAPTKPVDEYWHQFVLFTEEYNAFCAQFHGYFVHHNPLAGPDHATIFERTQHMVTKLFGAFENARWWFMPRPATSCKCTNGKLLAVA